jgi:hypothetical protein
MLCALEAHYGAKKKKKKKKKSLILQLFSPNLANKPFENSRGLGIITEINGD